MMYQKLLKFYEKYWMLLSAIALVTLYFLMWNCRNLCSGLLPKHDGLHGITAFATSMHSIRLSGEIAWWSPADITTGGWAEYYLGFLSPMGPTYGSVLFVGAAYITKLYGLLSAVIPEYPVYILLNYYITPILAVFFLFKFASLFLKSKYSYILLGGGYLLSGIGLQIDSWYYWQDQFFLWLFLYGVLGLLKENNVRKYYTFCASTICFVASANYWTLHNLLFIVCVLLLHLTTIHDIRDRIREIFKIVRKCKIITSITLICMTVWIIMIASVFLEQHLMYGRISGSIEYTIERVVERARSGNAPSFLVNELFNPVVGSFNSEINNYIHNARYIGAMLLPLIIISFFYRRNSIEFFQKLCILMFGICIIPGFLLPIWRIFFNFDQHYFYFYSHFWEISVLLLATMSFDEIIENREVKLNRVINFIISVAGIAFLGITCIESEPFRAVLLMLCLIIVSAFLLKKYGEGFQKVWIILFLCIFLGDMSRYYYESSVGDYEFTKSAFPRESEGDKRLFMPFENEENNKFSQALEEKSPPVINKIWPHNSYMPPVSYSNLEKLVENEDFVEKVNFSFDDGKDMHFYTVISDYKGDNVYSAENRIDEANYVFVEYGYNDFTIKYAVEQSGFTVANVLYDPKWVVKIDGKRVETFKANINYLSFEIEEGNHVIEMSYRPIARGIYPIASILLMGDLVIIYARKKKEERVIAN